MARKNLLASLDVGSAYTRCIISDGGQQGEVRVVGMCSRPSQGVRRGMIVDIDACAVSIKEVISFAERMAGGTVTSVFVGLSPLHAVLQPSRGMVAILGDGHEVTEEDIERVTQAAQVINMPPNREVIDVISREYIIDGYGGLRDPRGMVGMRLELEAHLVVGNLTATSNLRRAVQRAGYELAHFVLKPLALGEMLLSEDERELGAALIDIGAASSEIGYFVGGMLRQVGVVPLGGASVTNDLALGLKVGLAIAEKVKIDVDMFTGKVEDRAIDLSGFGLAESRKVYVRTLAEIVEPRLEELFNLVTKETLSLTEENSLPSSMVVTGGVANVRGISAVMKRYMPGVTRLSAEARGYVDDPGYNVAVGILSYVMAMSVDSSQESPTQRRGSGGKIARLAGWLRDFWE